MTVHLNIVFQCDRWGCHSIADLGEVSYDTVPETAIIGVKGFPLPEGWTVQHGTITCASCNRSAESAQKANHKHGE